MKKLTAGIFATLLAVVSVGAAHAEIASKGYVDQQVGTKADAATVSSLQGTVSEHTTQIAGKADKATTLAGYGITDGATKTELTSGLAGKVDNADIADMQVKTNLTTTLSGTSTDAQYPSAKAVWDTIQAETSDVASSGDLGALTTRVTTAEGEIDTLQSDMAGKANTADLGDLATLDAVGSAQITDGSVATADIADKAVTEAKLSDTVNASLDKADSALQKTTADATYAVKALETQVGAVSAENMGTTATTVVTAIKEVAGEAAAAQSTATGAQSAVDAVESTIGGYGDIVTHNAAEFATTGALTSGLAGKLDKTGTAARATADASGNEITKTYATKAEIADLATDENLAKKQDKTDNNLATTNKTVVGAINEVKTTADGASTAAGAAQDAADAAQTDATQALEDAATAQAAAKAAQTAADSKLPTATYNSEVGTVSATNMGTTATTVVTAIKEVAGEASGAQSTATAAQQAANRAQQTANAAIPAPTAACADSANKCVLVSSGAGNYSWEVIARNGEGA